MQQKQKWLLKYISDKRSELLVMGIAIEVPKGGSMDQRFSIVIEQIQNMEPKQQTLFNLLKDEYNQALRQKELDDMAKDQAATLNEQFRQAEKKKMLEAKNQKMQNIDNITNIDEMPDSIRKYEMILRKIKNEPGYKFVDAEFDHNKEVDILGEKIMGHQTKLNVTTWKRASEIPGAVLFRDGADCRDIIQGALGDCFLLSAFSVLGNERIKQLFEHGEALREEDFDFTKSGMFMICFPGVESPNNIVIIDDYLPFDPTGALAFTKGGEDGLELWPCILEKAYAKLYGSYS